MLKNTATTYGSVTKFFHWLVFILVTCLLMIGFFMGDIQEKTLRMTVINYHKMIGLFVLLLMLLRMTWAFLNPKPLLPNTPPWQLIIERIVHVSLYAVLIAMPLCGWIGSVAAGYAPHLFGVYFNLPIAPSKTVDDIAFTIHNALAIVIIVLVSLHILAALYHHFFKKDNVLLRMMPGDQKI